MLEESRHSPGKRPADAAPDDMASAAAVPESGGLTEDDDTAPREDKLVPGKAAAQSAWRDPWTWGIAALIFGAYLVISLYRLWTLTPSSWDLGIYTEYVKQWADLHAPIVDVRGPGFNLLGDHFQVIVALIAPFFRLFPTPATLLVVQALLTALSVFPVVQAGTALLGPGRGSGAARAIGFAYGFSWGLQQMVDFDFHEIAFAVPLLAFSLSALVRGRVRATLCWALPMVLVKEDQGFTIAVIGILMWLASVRGWNRIAASAPAGLFLACWGVGCSLLEISWIIPHFSATHRYAYWDLGGVVGGPGFSVGRLLEQVGHAYPVKLETLVLLLLPTAFIALGSPVAAVVIPSILLRFIATNPFYWGTTWHYNATAMPILFIAAIEAMACWRQAGAGGRWAGDSEAGAGGRSAGAWAEAVRNTWGTVTVAAGRHGAAMMAALAVALAFQFPLSNLWNGQTYEIGPNVAADQAAMAVVPDGATVTTTLNLLAPLAARCDTFWVGNSGNPDTQYIVFDGPNSGYSPAVTDVPAFIQQLHPGVHYQQVFVDDQVYVFKLG
jgi:uncharacterized membrane protein